MTIFIIYFLNIQRAIKVQIMTLKYKFETLRLIPSETSESILQVKSSNISTLRWDTEDAFWRSNTHRSPIHATSPPPHQSCCYQSWHCGIWTYDQQFGLRPQSYPWDHKDPQCVGRICVSLRYTIMQLDVHNSHKFSWKEVTLERVFSNYSFYLVNSSLNISAFLFCSL